MFPSVNGEATDRVLGRKGEKQPGPKGLKGPRTLLLVYLLKGSPAVSQTLAVSVNARVPPTKP